MELTISSPYLGALIALQPISYIVRLVLAALAFSAAVNSDRVVARVIGLVWLIVTGASLLWVGISNETIADAVLGVLAIVAAVYSWWHNRY